MDELTSEELRFLIARANNAAAVAPVLVSQLEIRSERSETIAKSLCHRNLVSRNGLVTDEGLEILEPYRAKRAILLASGFGSRMLPITINTPKPLVRVRGQRIIDTLLDALYAIGITEIYIVRGYLGEQFDQLLSQYPTLQFIDNPDYMKTNNISSAVLAKDHFENAYVFESDLLLKNQGLITKYQNQSNYLGVAVEATQDWCFETSAGIITGLKKGGVDCHHMYGISYWTSQDGKKLAKDLQHAFQNEANKQRFWDDVPCVICRENYQVSIRECSRGDIEEIDSIQELQAVDSSYCMYE